MSESFKTNFIPQIVEKTPFAGTPAQNFFYEWCRINDSIVPQFISREEWKKRGINGILEDNDQGGQTLFLPADLHLWEMMDVIKAIDHDTLARNQKKRGERADKIRELGKTFEKAGIYLSEYMPGLEDNRGKEIAEAIAHEFYQYGLSLQRKKRNGDQIPDSSELSLEDKAKLDRWFLGRDVYQKRLARLGDNLNEEQIEETRKRLLSNYFKALGQKGHREDGKKPWETKVGPRQHLQDRARRQITKAVETPESELNTAIFRRGVEKLITEMKTPKWENAIQEFLKNGVDFDVAKEKVKLINILEIPRLKKELEKTRQIGDIAEISEKELEIAKKIQKAVSSYDYAKGANNPSEMIKYELINCVGASILGGGLLDEVGIKYLHVGLPGHSSTVLITTDGKAYWQDFTPTPGNFWPNYTEIKSDMVEEKVDFLNVPESGVTLRFKDWNPYLHVKGKLKVRLSRPEIGLQSHIISNTAVALYELGLYEKAIRVYQQAINIDPKYIFPYIELGRVFRRLGHDNEAIKAYKQAINIDPTCTEAYNGLGNTLLDLGREEEAIESFKHAISINPTLSMSTTTWETL